MSSFFLKKYKIENSSGICEEKQGNLEKILIFKF